MGHYLCHAFWLPFFSDYISWWGSQTCHKKNFHRLLSKGKNVSLCTGGFEEATLYVKGEHRVYLKHRQGFIKYALQHGYSVYPMYSFGEEKTYTAYSGALKFRLALNAYKIPGILFYGWLGSILPYRNHEMITVVGKPLVCPIIANPAKEQVNEYHAKYIETLQAMFDKYKTQYADPGSVLKIY